MKKILFVFIFILGSYALFTYNFKTRFNTPELPPTIFDGFSVLDRELWYVGEWESHKPAYSKVFFEDGILSIPVNEADKGAYLLSKPIEIGRNERIQIKRVVKIHAGSDYFAGGMALFQTEDVDIRPDITKAMPLGNAGILVEYAKDLLDTNTRPGDVTFRLLAPNWSQDGNYVLIDPIFDEWFTETLTYNVKTGDVVYNIEGKDYTLKSAALSQPYLRIWMHSYGHFTGHEVAVDSIEIKWLPKEELEQKKTKK